MRDPPEEGCPQLRRISLRPKDGSVKLAAAASVLVFAAGFAASGTTAQVSGPTKKRHNNSSQGTGSTSTGATTSTSAPVSTTAPTTTSTAPTPPPPPPPSPVGTILFRGDYETGNFAQWDQVQSHTINGAVNPAYQDCGVGITDASIVNSPAPAQGGQAARFTVYTNTSGANGCATNPRAEVASTQAETGGYEGQQWWYGWWVMFPASDANRFLCTTSDWNLFTQFHQPGTGSPQVSFGVDPSQAMNSQTTCASPALYFKEDAGPQLKKQVVGPHIQYGHWYHFVFHAKWSAQPNGGFVQVFVDGNEVIPLTTTQTLYATTSTGVIGAYWKQGFYGADMTNGQGIGDYLDGACRADSYAAAAAC
jgi:polysaccharide lyase-like protein